MLRTPVVRVVLALGGGLACASTQPERAGERIAPEDQSTLAVGRNVRVSGPTETPYHEMVIAANPRNRGQLVGSSMVERAIGGLYFTHIFASRDGGRTWLQSHRPTTHNVSADPQVVYTWSGAALYAGLGQIDSTRTGYPAGLEVFRSTDGGLTWQKVANMGRNHDRLIFVADHHSERFRGRVYLAILTGIPAPPDTVGRRRIVVYRSLDDGQTWLPPVNATTVDGLPSDSPVIFSDGAIFVPLRTDAFASARPDPTNPDSAVGRMGSPLSVDGGETFGPLRPLPDYEFPPREFGWIGGNNPVFGAARSGRARDRLYMVNSVRRSGFFKVVIAHSDDRGATWSAFRPIDRREGPGHQYNASIAVNNDGVVGVSWLDTRHSKGATEYDLYFAASLDGGASFEPARRVSERSGFRRGPGNARIDANAMWPPRDSLQTISTGTVLHDEAGGHLPRHAQMQATTAPERAASAPSVSDLARSLVEAPRARKPLLAPDASWVLYQVSRASVAKNETVTELLWQRLNHSGAPAGTPTVMLRRTRNDYEQFSVSRCPGSDCFILARESGDTGIAAGAPGVVRFDLATGTGTRLAVRDTGAAAAGRKAVTELPAAHKWSPDGKMVGYRALVVEEKLDTRRGVHVSEGWLARLDRKEALFVLDVASGIATQITPDSIGVAMYDWSPSGRELVFSGSVNRGYNRSNDDLFVVERGTGRVRALVTDIGQQTNPSYSPDGKWVSFSSTAAVVLAGRRLALVPAAGGPVQRVMKDGAPTIYVRDKCWSPDGRRISFGSLSHHSSSGLVQVDVESGQYAMINEDPMLSDGEFSFSADCGVAAYVREGLNTPPELYVRRIGSPPRQITRLNDGFALRAMVRVDTLSWPSRDGKFQIQGTLLSPAGPGVGRRLPTLVYVHGGPGSMRREFDGMEQGAHLTLAARGYAILFPYTRGRGGYDDALALGIRDAQGYGRMPYEDLMEGVEAVVRRGIADSVKLGIYGHSYGGYLTSYAITQTNRFRAAINYEGGPTAKAFGAAASARVTGHPDQNLVWYSDAPTPTMRAAMDEQSPEFNGHLAKTPTLFLYGGSSGLFRGGMAIYNGLRAYGVPAEFVVYDAGHDIRHPAAVVDFHQRVHSWFDYWLRDSLYPDTQRQAAFAQWKGDRGRSARQ